MLLSKPELTNPIWCYQQTSKLLVEVAGGSYRMLCSARTVRYLRRTTHTLFAHGDHYVALAFSIGAAFGCVHSSAEYCIDLGLFL